MPSAYHITRIENLTRIWAAGCIHCDDSIPNLGQKPQTFSHENIKERRRGTRVTAGPGGTLSAYAPFYFANRSPMLSTVYYEDCRVSTKEQERIVHLRIDVEQVVASGLEVVFSDGHGIMALTDFYDDLTDLVKVDWEIIGGRYWNDTKDQPDRKRKKQAEFLVYNSLPVDQIVEIGVKTPRIKEEVEFLLANERLPPVEVHHDWYY